jgi:hypothetical protein
VPGAMFEEPLSLSQYAGSDKAETTKITATRLKFKSFAKILIIEKSSVVFTPHPDLKIYHFITFEHSTASIPKILVRRWHINLNK